MSAQHNNQTQFSDSEADRRVRRVELLISNLLRTGVIASLTVVVIGLILSFIHHPGYISSPEEMQRITQIGAVFPHTWSALFTGLLNLQGRAVVAAGLMLLILTPVARVAISIFAFIYQKDRIYTFITLTVLCLLLLSFVLGAVE